VTQATVCEARQGYGQGSVPEDWNTIGTLLCASLRPGRLPVGGQAGLPVAALLQPQCRSQAMPEARQFPTGSQGEAAIAAPSMLFQLPESGGTTAPQNLLCLSLTVLNKPTRERIPSTYRPVAAGRWGGRISSLSLRTSKTDTCHFMSLYNCPLASKVHTTD
jgi:hypothetical protein